MERRPFTFLSSLLLSFITLIVLIILIIRLPEESIQFNNSILPIVVSFSSMFIGIGIVILATYILPTPFKVQRFVFIYICAVILVAIILVGVLLTNFPYSKPDYLFHLGSAFRVTFISGILYLLYLVLSRKKKKYWIVLLNILMPVIIFYLVYLSSASLILNNSFLLVVPLGLAIHYANTGAVVFSSFKPLDFGKNFLDGRRLLGDGVSIRGTLCGILSGFVLGIIAYPNNFVLVVLGSISGILGDIMGSFVKRRFGLPSGYQVMLLDQLDSLLPILLLSLFCPKLPLTKGIAVLIVICTVLVPTIGNVYLYLTDQKRVPW